MTLGPARAAWAAERAPFAGAWSCAQLVDNEVVGDWWPERYAEDGGPLADGAGATPAGSARRLSARVYDVVFPDGGRSRIAMKAPFVFVRSTAEHAYLCVRRRP
ncbi:hypothetical protein NK718_20405 [Alsobacter sp. SYSU M60028]|uniref:Uncharacterized protein n=1 Tax=Alsobacter ponti TaxID=2962936 RepID=A0ABT1LIX6_9HYPH|nr:hypothetical protein [Alsobacter ponti]MCP8940896.1 hypothetical protein [Alsobacter ponti]